MTAGHEARLAQRRQAEEARQNDFLVYVVGRPLMFIAWTLIFWGTVVALAGLYVFVARGPQMAVVILLPRTGMDFVNAALAATAVIVWIGVITAHRRASRHGEPSP